MMADYRTPGVYVEEVPAAVKPIAGVGTSTAGFIGVVEYCEVEPTVEALKGRTLKQDLPLFFVAGSDQDLDEHLIDGIKQYFEERSNASATVKVTQDRKLTELTEQMTLGENISEVDGAEKGKSLGQDDLLNKIKQQFPDPDKTIKVKEKQGRQRGEVDRKLTELTEEMTLAKTISDVDGAEEGKSLGDNDLLNKIKQQFPDPNKTIKATEEIQVAKLTPAKTLNARVDGPTAQKDQEISEVLAFLISESSKAWGDKRLVRVEPLTGPGQAKLCTNFGGFTQAFGGFSTTNKWQNWLARAVYGFFNNGGTRCWVTRADTNFIFPSGTEVTDENVEDVIRMVGEGHAVQIYTSDPANDPKPQAKDIKATAAALKGKWLAQDIDIDFDKLSAALDTFKPIDEIALVAIPGATNQKVHTALIGHCENPHLQDRFAILDGQQVSPGSDLSSSKISSGVGNSSYGAIYFPWIDVGEKDQNKNPVYMPPSGHVAGVYARVDTERGVHKAPANEVIRGALDLERLVSKREQAGLNPEGINVIRKFNGNVTVWGARTWADPGKEPEWKYINVRRLFLYLRKSIEQGTQWVVFEPNDPALWAKITRNVTAFLTNVWRDGALFGATPQQAFYVKCDAETNPPELRDQGQVVTEIGVAVTKPAEFVVFRVSQWAAPGG